MWFFYIENFFFAIAILFVTYNLIYAIAALFPQKKRAINTTKKHRFLILFPAYKEDSVILDSIQTFLKQEYSKEFYDIAVISDSMQESTNKTLSLLPITVFDVKLGLKSRSLIYALEHTDASYDKVIIMDADNTVEADFLTEINKICHTSQVLQLHRTQKEISTKVAQWDGISEEVNNNIFRKGHVNLKISSALIGSGMVFDYTLFNETIKQCNTFAEDKELEVILASRGIFIDYVNNIKVYDEKTAKEHIFMRQRTRWTHAQIIAFSLIMQRLKWENLNLYFIDKLIQWIPYPRQIRISIALLFLTLNLFLYPAAAIKWIILIGVKILTILLAIPRRKYNKQFLLGLLKLPQLILLLIKSIFKSITRIIKKDNSFMSTPHSNKNKLS